jgi:hypothetical protein
MNERIKQLALECYSPYSSFDHEKFAESIVKECAELAKNKSVSIVNKTELYGDDAREIDTAKATAWQFLVLEAEIKKHFGVEE